MPKDHYVAQTYLKNFGDLSQAGMLHAYKKPNGDYFPCWPADVCREWDGDENPLMIDSKYLGDFRKIFEPHWTPSIKNICSNKISHDDKFKISGYIANLMTCTPAWTRVMGKIYEKQELGSLSFGKEMKKKYGRSDERWIEGIEMLERGELRLQPTPNYMKALATQWLFASAIEIYNQDWKIISNDSANSFLTSDNPVAIDYTGMRDCMVRCLPITPHLCICIKCNRVKYIDHKNLASYLKLPPSGEIKMSDCSSQCAKHINRLVIKCAEDCVFSSEKNAQMNVLVAKYGRYKVDSDYIEIPGEDDSIYQGTILRVREVES